MTRMRTWQGAVFALAAAFVLGPAAADTADPGTATMAPVASGGETIDPAHYQTPEAFRWRITKTEWKESDERASQLPGGSDHQGLHRLVFQR